MGSNRKGNRTGNVRNKSNGINKSTISNRGQCNHQPGTGMGYNCKSHEQRGWRAVTGCRSLNNHQRVQNQQQRGQVTGTTVQNKNKVTNAKRRMRSAVGNKINERSQSTTTAVTLGIQSTMVNQRNKSNQPVWFNVVTLGPVTTGINERRGNA